MQPPILLLNCRVCDDIVRVHEDSPRICFCGQSAAKFVDGEFVHTGTSRVIEIELEEYDGAAPGEPRRWTVRREEGK